MLIFRVVGLFLIVLALMLLGADMVSTLENSAGTTIRSFAQILALLGADTDTWTQRLPPLIGNFLAAVFSWPGWAVVGIPGVLFGMVGGPSRSKHRAPPLPPYRPVDR